MLMNHDEVEEITISQYEIRFLPILNFDMEVKPVLAGFMKLFDSFNFRNKGNPNELIELKSSTDAYSIFVKWDALILRIDQNLEQIDSSSTSIQIFFQIYEKLKQLPTFSEVKDHFLFNLYLKLDDNTAEYHTESFINYYFGDRFNFLKEEDQLDTSIIFESKRADGITLYHAGPYVSINDFDTRKMPLQDESLSELLFTKKGLLLELKQATKVKTKDYGLSSFMGIKKNALKLIKNFWNA